MDTKKIEALVALLDDNDQEVVEIVQREIRNIGEQAIPLLEDHLEISGSNPFLKKQLEGIIQELHVGTARSRLANWAAGNKEDLLQGLWAVASYESPEISLEELRITIQDLYMAVWLEMRDNLHPNDQIRILNQVFFDKYGFKPNTRNYYASENSMINKVLEDKQGNPISMCSVYLLVAQRLNLPVFGVNLPNLFVLTYKIENFQFYINVFNRGVIFTRKDIESHIKQMNMPLNEVFFEPCTNEDIVKRTLRNLIYAYKKANQTEKFNDARLLLSVFEGEG